VSAKLSTSSTCRLGRVFRRRRLWLHQLFHRCVGRRKHVRAPGMGPVAVVDSVGTSATTVGDVLLLPPQSMVSITCTDSFHTPRTGDGASGTNHVDQSRARAPSPRRAVRLEREYRPSSSPRRTLARLWPHSRRGECGRHRRQACQSTGSSSAPGIARTTHASSPRIFGAGALLDRTTAASPGSRHVPWSSAPCNEERRAGIT
jgi:hypothetical protein